jgi:hypothetical protein
MPLLDGRKDVSPAVLRFSCGSCIAVPTNRCANSQHLSCEKPDRLQAVYDADMVICSQVFQAVRHHLTAM